MVNTKGIRAFLHDVKAVSPAIATLILIVIAAVAAAGVGILVQSSQKNAQDQTGNKNMDAMGTINIKGSTTLLPISQAAGIEFMKKYPAVKINVAGGGSSIGLLTAYTTTSPLEDLGASSSIWAAKTVNGVNIPSREDAVIQLAGANAKVYETKIGTGMIVVAGHLTGVDNINIVNVTGTFDGPNKTLNINYTELQSGYVTGTFTPFAYTGGVVTLVQRSDPSGTEDTFSAWIGLQDASTTQLLSTVNAVGKQGNQGIRDYISQTPNTIGFVDIGYTAGQVPNGAANVIAASQLGVPANIGNKGVDGKYDAASKINTGVTDVTKQKGLARDLFYYNQGLPTGAIKAYLDWMMTPDGQKIVQNEGFFSN